MKGHKWTDKITEWIICVPAEVEVSMRKEARETTRAVNEGSQGNQHWSGGVGKLDIDMERRGKGSHGLWHGGLLVRSVHDAAVTMCVA